MNLDVSSHYLQLCSFVTVLEKFEEIHHYKCTAHVTTFMFPISDSFDLKAKS